MPPVPQPALVQYRRRNMRSGISGIVGPASSSLSIPPTCPRRTAPSTASARTFVRVSGPYDDVECPASPGAGRRVVLDCPRGGLHSQYGNPSDLSHCACILRQGAIGGSCHDHHNGAPPPRWLWTATPDPSLTDRIVLKSSRTTAGQSIDGTLLVFNHAAAAINLTKTCRPSFVVALTNSRYVPQVAFPAVCSSQPLVIVTGMNRLPVKVTTTYLECQQGGSVSAGPACVANEAPPLPAGSYDAVLVGDGLALPEPQPVPVTLTKGSE